MARKGRKSHLDNALRRYGRNAFRIELIRSDARDFAELQRQEVAEITRRDTIRTGYNTGLGGSIGTSKEIRIGDRVFPSRNAAAVHFGIDVGVFNLRRKSARVDPGGGCGDPAAYEVRKTIDRNRTENLPEAWRPLRVLAGSTTNWFTIGSRRRSGLSVRRWSWIRRRNRAVSGKSIRLRGKVYASIAKGAQAHGIDPEALSNRMRKGDTPDKALTRCTAVRQEGRHITLVDHRVNRVDESIEARQMARQLPQARRIDA